MSLRKGLKFGLMLSAPLWAIIIVIGWIVL